MIVSREEMKEYLRVSFEDEDDLIDGLIETAEYSSVYMPQVTDSSDPEYCH